VLRTRVPQLLLAAVAGYEGRSLLSSLSRFISATAHAPALLQLGWWVLVLSGLGAVAWSVGRGLDRVAEVPRWTQRLVGLWLVFCSAVVVLVSAQGAFAGHGLSHQLLGGVGGLWTEGPALLGGALVLAVSLEGRRWLSRRPVSLALSRADARLRPSVRRQRAASERDPGLIPLLAGWSDRGPPPSLTSHTI
jgi:hypothetical protein